MALDHILANPDNTYLDIERQKILTLNDLHGVEPEVMPCKLYGREASTAVSRRFVDRFLISFRRNSEESPNRFTFTYIDSGFETMSAFTTYLRQYKRLFEALREFDLVYVGHGPLAVRRSSNYLPTNPFPKCWEAPVGARYRPASGLFSRPDLFERGQSRIPSRERMDLLRDAWDEFGGPFHDALLGRWKQAGEIAVPSDLQVKMTRHGHFLRYVLPFKYDYFGSIDTSSRSLPLAGGR
jgi:hypothetical protein